MSNTREAMLPREASVEDNSGERGTLDADSWIAAAFLLLGKDGIDGVRIERLARMLGVTKGSFYWHFKDRDALYAAMLERWRRNATLGLFEWNLEPTDDPRKRFAMLLRLPCQESTPDQSLDTELALRLWARRDDRAKAALEEVEELRIRYFAALLTSCGVPQEQLRARAILAYSYTRIAGGKVDEATIARCEELLLGQAP